MPDDIIDRRKVDTPTNRQALLAYVARLRARGDWPSAYTAGFMLAGVEPNAANDTLLRPYLKLVRDLCETMEAEGLLTYSAHGYLGVAGQPRRAF